MLAGLCPKKHHLYEASSSSPTGQDVSQPCFPTCLTLEEALLLEVSISTTLRINVFFNFASKAVSCITLVLALQ